MSEYTVAGVDWAGNSWFGIVPRDGSYEDYILKDGPSSIAYWIAYLNASAKSSRRVSLPYCQFPRWVSLTWRIRVVMRFETTVGIPIRDVNRGESGTNVFIETTIG
ncbi:hypothetical protein JCM17823_23610 [Halorubrum gandharaense]